MSLAFFIFICKFNNWWVSGPFFRIDGFDQTHSDDTTDSGARTPKLRVMAWFSCLNTYQHYLDGWKWEFLSLGHKVKLMDTNVHKLLIFTTFVSLGWSKSIRTVIKTRNGCGRLNYWAKHLKISKLIQLLVLSLIDILQKIELEQVRKLSKSRSISLLTVHVVVSRMY